MLRKESIRLYPSAWILGRELVRDCTIDGYNFGTVNYFSQWTVHRDARFFNDREQLNTDRWQDNLKQPLPLFTLSSKNRPQRRSLNEINFYLGSIGLEL